MTRLPPSFYPQLVKLTDEYLKAGDEHLYFKTAKLKAQIRELLTLYQRVHSTGPTKSSAEADHDH